jgi:hypothetical protein
MEDLEITRVYTDAEFEAEIIDGEIEMLSKMIQEMMQKQDELDMNIAKIRIVRNRLMSTVGENVPMEEQLDLPFEVVTD